MEVWLENFGKSYQCKKSQKRKITFDCEQLTLTTKSYGLATILTFNCTRKNYQHRHMEIYNTEMTTCEELGRTTRTSRYALDMKVALAVILNCGSHYDIICFIKVLGLPWVTNKTYREIERMLGSRLKFLVRN